MIHERRRVFTSLLTVVALLCVSLPAVPAQEQEEEHILAFNAALVPGVSVGEALAGISEATIVTRTGVALIGGSYERLTGVALAPLWNGTATDSRGALLSGAVNRSHASFHGTQLAGLVNYTGGESDGFQSAGVVNVASESDGVQLAGIANVAGNGAPRFQAAGIVNVAEESHGVQVALINLAEESRGVPVGLVSYVSSVGLRYDVWADETGRITTAIRSGNRSVSNYFGFSYAPGEAEYPLSLMAGIGVQRHIMRSFYLAPEFLSHSLFDEDLVSAGNMLRLRLLAGFLPMERVALFAGPSLAAFLANRNETHDPAPWHLYEGDASSALRSVWAGFTLGVRVSGRALVMEES